MDARPVWYGHRRGHVVLAYQCRYRRLLAAADPGRAGLPDDLFRPPRPDPFRLVRPRRFGHHRSGRGALRHQGRGLDHPAVFLRHFPHLADLQRGADQYRRQLPGAPIAHCAAAARDPGLRTDPRFAGGGALR
ncbi:hypothetical protein D9M71_601430 [compost metagenome]